MNQKLSDLIPGSYHRSETSEKRSREQEYADWYNSQEGDLNKSDGHNCPVCNNRGRIAEVVQRAGYEECILTDCKCMTVRKSISQMKRSGLLTLSRRCSFDSFETDQEWQKGIKEKVLRFTEQDSGWLYLGGQVGSGKTHLGVAAAAKIMHETNEDARYYVWPEALRATWGDFDAYQRFVSEAMGASILYIDDLFKPVRDRKTGMMRMPSENEISTAFDIVNFRYINPGTYTIITCEFPIEELCGIDEALGSRIAEACRKNGCCISIGKNPGRNYRMKDIIEL